MNSKFLGAISAVLLLVSAVGTSVAQTVFVPWPDHNFSGQPASFGPDNTCGPGQTPADGCWASMSSLGAPIMDLDPGNVSPASANISSGATNSTYTSFYYAYDDLSDQPQAIQDQLPEGVIYMRMRLNASPLSNNPNPTGPYASRASWNFIFDTNGDGWSDFLAQTYGVDNMQNLFFNDSVTSQVIADGDTFCQNGGGLLWQNPTALQAPALGCVSSGQAYCDYGQTRVINKTAFAATADEHVYLDMQFPLHAFRSCRSGPLYTPPGGGDTVQGDLAFSPDQPFLLCATTSTQDTNAFLKDFASNDGTYPPGGNFDPTISELACSDPCTLNGGCEEGVLLLEAAAVCGTGTNSSPVELTAQVLATIGQVGGTPQTTVSDLSFYYWQVGVSTQWTLATPTVTSSNPLLSPSGAINEFQMFWDTTGLDLSQSSTFQIRVEANDSLGTTAVETLVEYDIGACATTGTPVSLAHVASQQAARSLEIQWSTSGEIANAGFNLYGESVNGRWYQLNDDLIASEVVDSVEPQHYSFSIRRNDVQRIFIEDVDVRGVSKLHGPYDVGQSHGRRPEIQPIDWEAVRFEGEARRQERTGGWQRQNYDPVRLLVDRDGVYRVSYEQLVAQGLDLAGVPVNFIALTNAGQPVAFHTEANGRFGRGDYLEFVGFGIDSTYTTDNVYTLHVNRSDGKRMNIGRGSIGGSSSKADNRRPATAVTSHVATLSYGEERKYSAGSPTDTPWYDTRMLAYDSPRTWHYSFTLDGPDARQTARIDLDYWGMTSWADVQPDHSVVLELNGQPLHEDRFNGRIARNPSIQLPAGLLLDGENTLTVRLPGDTGAPWDIVVLNGFDVHYTRPLSANDGYLEFSGSAATYQVEGVGSMTPLVYAVTGNDVTRIADLQVTGFNPASVTFNGVGQSARYFVTDESRLLAPRIEPGRSFTDISSGRADYLIITHPNFETDLRPLVAFHSGLGRQVRVVNIFDIYDQFSAGVVDAEAIGAYIRSVVDIMGVEHVLLVGGDTYDYKNQTGSGSISFIPSLYAATGALVNFAPADGLYVDLDGDQVPDLPIGRFPVRTSSELQEIIGKTLEFANRDYGRRAVLAADLEETNVSFTQTSEGFADLLGDDWSLAEAYLDRDSVASARERLIKGINLGSSLTTFVGHSSYSVWTFDGLLSAADVANLDNSGRPTAVVQFGCWNTYHVIPSYNTMGHSFMLSEDRGAAVVVGSATWTSVESGQQLGDRLMPLLATGDMTVGQALTAAKQDLATVGGDRRDAILGWTILGDPALVIGSIQ